MALHLKHIKEWNALHISLNGKTNPGTLAKYYQFLDQLPEKVHPDQFSVMIPDAYFSHYLSQFEGITTMNQTSKSILGTEEVIVPETSYELKHLDKMKLAPYPFQELGAQFLMSEKQGIVGDEVGLGKTSISLTAINELIQSGIASKILIIMPASLKYQWQNEIRKFTEYDSIVVDGTKKQREKIYDLFPDAFEEILIAGYETVRNDIDYYVDY